MSKRKPKTLGARKAAAAAVETVFSRQLLQKAVAILERGGLIAYPTRCLYGLGADALNADAVKRVYRVKQRPADKPLSILIPDRQGIEQWVTGITPGALDLMDRFWPGKVTFVLQASASLPKVLLGGTGTIGIRLPAHRVAHALVAEFGRPVTATSANLSGSPGCVSVRDMPPKMANQLDLILDAGQLQGGTGSTVVDLTGDRPLVLREGVVAAGEIDSAW